MIGNQQLRAVARRTLPKPIRRALRTGSGRARQLQQARRDRQKAPWGRKHYEKLYESVARSVAPETSIGGGDYDAMGTIMLSALVDIGLESDHTLVDFGCGTGRLAMHAVPYLTNGRYVGTDISETMLRHAREKLAAVTTTSSCEVRFVQQNTPTFDLPPDSVDMFAAFSVFTHMEHEDAFNYLCDARRAIKTNGRFVLSCLTMDLADAHTVFLQSAALSLEQRWSTVRHVTTSYDYFNAVATLAGWNVRRWYRGDRAMVPLLGNPAQRTSLGQSICVLEPRAISELT